MLVSVELTGTAWPVLTGGLFHYSSAPHHRRFEMGITNSSGGVGFMSMLMRGASTAGSTTGGDGGPHHRRFANHW